MREERIAFFAVVETHLTDIEVPPHEDFVGEGCNKTGQDREDGKEQLNIFGRYRSNEPDETQCASSLLPV